MIDLLGEGRWEGDFAAAGENSMAGHASRMRERGRAFRETEAPLCGGTWNHIQILYDTIHRVIKQNKLHRSRAW